MNVKETQLFRESRDQNKKLSEQLQKAFDAMVAQYDGKKNLNYTDLRDCENVLEAHKKTITYQVQQ